MISVKRSVARGTGLSIGCMIIDGITTGASVKARRAPTDDIPENFAAASQRIQHPRATGQQRAKKAPKPVATPFPPRSHFLTRSSF